MLARKSFWPQINADYQDIDSFVFTAEIAEVGVGAGLALPNKGAQQAAPLRCALQALRFPC
jgi:hypothetical protein